MKFYTFCQKFVAAYIRAMFRVEVHGHENVPEGAVLVCANHMSMWDAVFIGACIKTRQVRFMAKQELFKIPVVKGILKALGAFPVSRGAADVRAIKTTIGLLKEGECVGMFPQGTRRPSVMPRKTPIRHGAGMCAFHSKSDILPVAVVNKKIKMVPFIKTHVVIGKPIPYDSLGFTDGDKEQFEKASGMIFDKVCDLFEDAYEKL
ncbi:MAG: 1-acyl-sn-glycerol-3-phosphate acyltransferase [Clostridia bacterium]|nr:1-acyl-sn-glycerol-3-phosphate acyltransferase [Clostridia bacterium]